MQHSVYGVFSLVTTRKFNYQVPHHWLNASTCYFWCQLQAKNDYMQTCSVLMEVCSFQVPLTAEAVKRPVAFIAYKKVSLT